VGREEAERMTGRRKARGCRCSLCFLWAWLEEHRNEIVVHVAGHLVAAGLLAIMAWSFGAQLGAPVSFVA